MKRSTTLQLLSLLVLTLGVMTAWAARPVVPQAGAEFPTTPVIQAAASSSATATEAATMEGSAALFILGMSLLLLIPVGVELLAPKSVGRAFRLHQQLMSRRALP